jgi:hypothetical protein
MNDITVFLKVIKLPVVSKEKTTKVDMSYIEEIFAEFKYFGNSNNSIVSKKVDDKYEIVFIGLSSLCIPDSNIYYNIYYANGHTEICGIGCYSFINQPRLFLRTIENHAREYWNNVEKEENYLRKII